VLQNQVFADVKSWLLVSLERYRAKSPRKNRWIYLVRENPYFPNC